MVVFMADLEQLSQNPELRRFAETLWYKRGQRDRYDRAAEDVNEALFRISRQITAAGGKLDMDEDAFIGFTFGVIRNCHNEAWRTFCRNNMKEERKREYWRRQGGDGNAPSVLEKYLAQRLAEYVRVYHPTFWQLYELREIERLTWQEISNITGQNRGTLSSRYSRGLAELRQVFEAEE